MGLKGIGRLFSIFFVKKVIILVTGNSTINQKYKNPLSFRATFIGSFRARIFGVISVRIAIVKVSIRTSTV